MKTMRNQLLGLLGLSWLAYLIVATDLDPNVPCEIRQYYCDKWFREVPAPTDIGSDKNNVIRLCVKAVDGQHYIRDILEGNMDKETSFVKANQCPYRVDEPDTGAYNFDRPTFLQGRQPVKQDLVRSYNALQGARKRKSMGIVQLVATIDPKMIEDDDVEIHLTMSGIVDW